MKKLLVLFFVMLAAVNLFAQSPGNKNLSGSLGIDSRIAFDNSKADYKTDDSNEIPGIKSPFLAGLLSAALPGAGEFYNGSYIKSAVFVAVEAAAITVGLIYNKKGDDQTSTFEDYANQHWDVTRYAKWTMKHATEINAGVNPADYQVFDQFGKVNWNELNKLEGALGSYYSHRLPAYGEQQYFELIGKYHQFNVGWDDFGDENTPYSYFDGVTERFTFYSKMRGKANDYYNVASKAVLVIVTNHIISAIDAAWSASRINKNLEVSAELKRVDLGLATDYYPQLNLRYSF